MKKAFQIFKRDIKRLFHNRAALLIVVGVCILPSLYAWFNIAANMDPYVNTAGIKIAIVNEDSGADNEKLSLNAGNTIASNLKENDKLGWTFVARQEAIKGVKSGEYYAAIIMRPGSSGRSLPYPPASGIRPRWLCGIRSPRRR